MLHRRTHLLVGVLILAMSLPPCTLAQDGPITWDPNTLTLVQKGAGYGRMIRLRGGEILCCFSQSRAAWVRPSADDGKTWGPKVLVARSADGSAANAELIQLRNGTILCFWNLRPQAQGKAFAIMVTSSVERGRSWSSSRELYRAGAEFENGCWEPAAVQLPTGEVQLFFANEGPYRTSAEQEITLLRSHDNGATWSRPSRLAFRAGHRDGMPVPLVLRDGKGIAVAIEDNGLAGKFKPAILHTSLKDNWGPGFVGGNSPRRWPALNAPLPANVYAGAPYLCQLPSGATVLSVQSDEGGRKTPQMVVYLGDADARKFASKSIPFQIGPGTSGLWNALFAKAPHTVTALSTTTIRGVRGLWAIDGHVTEVAEAPARKQVPYP